MIFRTMKGMQKLRIAVLAGLLLTGVLLAGALWGQDTQPKSGGSSPAAPVIPGKKIPFPRPQSHAANWLQYHGASAELYYNEAGGKGRACYTCHEKNDCIDCHNTMMPRDHTNTWRTLSHGFQAEGNRERCLNCHRQDYCVRCHNETAPRSHRGRWNSIVAVGTPDTPTHCTWCHYDGGFAPADNCVVCHKQALHSSAPHSITPALNCTSGLPCHN